MIIYNKPTVTITYVSDMEYIHVLWKEYTLSSEFHKAIDFMFDFMLRENLYRLLSNITEQSVVSPGDQDYTRNKTIQFVNSAGRFKSAFVVRPKSPSTYGAMRFSRLLLKETGLELNRLFESEEEAVEWLIKD